jgi:hypothetical protein
VIKITATCGKKYFQEIFWRYYIFFHKFAGRMKYITLPDTLTGDTHLSFYLAMEEYVARHIDEPDCVFM